MPAAFPPSDLALAAQLAALLEVTAAKPGNVDPTHDFGDTTFEDFLWSALAIGPAVGDAGRAGVGPTVSRAVREARRATSDERRARATTDEHEHEPRVRGTSTRTNSTAGQDAGAGATARGGSGNTNLGIVLLFAPLACAAATTVHGSGPLRARLARVLAGLTVADAEAVYAAIRLAEPGGLGEAPEQDVRDAPTVTLREAMALAAERDAIAREYATDFAITFEIGVPALVRATAAGLPPRASALEAFLAILAQVPDTLIARKRGAAAARDVSARARVVAALGAGTPERARALAELDASLRDPANTLNPGTTADLTAAAIFVQLLEQGLGAPE